MHRFQSSCPDAAQQTRPCTGSLKRHTVMLIDRVCEPTPRVHRPSTAKEKCMPHGTAWKAASVETQEMLHPVCLLDV